MLAAHHNLKLPIVSNDHRGNYMKLVIKLLDGTAIIRWGLDDFTFKRLKDIVCRNYFDRLEKDYHYELLPYVGASVEKPKGKKKFIGIVRCV